MMGENLMCSVEYAGECMSSDSEELVWNLEQELTPYLYVSQL